jgi:hypothetical protein
MSPAYTSKTSLKWVPDLDIQNSNRASSTHFMEPPCLFPNHDHDIQYHFKHSLLRHISMTYINSSCDTYTILESEVSLLTRTIHTF